MKIILKNIEETFRLNLFLFIVLTSEFRRIILIIYYIIILNKLKILFINKVFTI